VPELIIGFLSCPPVIRDLLIVEVPHARDERLVALLSGPVDGIMLGPCGVQHVVGMILNYEVGNRASVRAALWTRFNIEIRHVAISSVAGCLARRDTTFTWSRSTLRRDVACCSRAEIEPKLDAYRTAGAALVEARATALDLWPPVPEAIVVTTNRQRGFFGGCFDLERDLDREVVWPEQVMVEGTLRLARRPTEVLQAEPLRSLLQELRDDRRMIPSSTST
jgi:hypothetical protein